MENSPFKTFNFADGHKLELHFDPDPMNPRDWDNMGTMAFFHGRYELGDKEHGLDVADFGGWNEMAKHIVEEMDGVVVLPVRMYDHSGIGFATGLDALRYPFNCPFDSMMIGFMFVTKAKLVEEYGDDPEAIMKATKCLKAELDVYNQYHGGGVCGFVLCDEDGEHTESCWGFYGHDPIENGIVDHIDSKYNEELKALV